MSVNVVMLNFSKRENSTAQPDVTGITPISCELKEDTSIINPVLIFSPGILPTPAINPIGIYNYADIPNFRRYYYIRDWVYTLGRWEAYLECDVLASYKSLIGGRTVYVERAASASNGNIIDTFYPAKTDCDITRVALAASWITAPSGGCFVVGIVNYQSSNQVGAVSYYALTFSQMSSLMNFLFTNNIFTASNITEIGEGLFKSLFNPFQYIVSCMWFPFYVNSFGSTQTDVKVGYWSTGINGTMVSSLQETTYLTGTIPNHPQISRGAYLNREPFTKLTLYVEPFGEIPIDTSYLSIGNYLYSKVIVDHITGQALLRVAISENSSTLNHTRIITERMGMIGIPIQLAQIMTDYAGTITSGLSAATGLLSGNILGAISGAMSAVSSQMPKVSTTGSNGSWIMNVAEASLIVEHYKLVDENNAEFGRPLMTTKQINTLSGFIKCGAGDIELPGLGAEREKVMQYMINGFYYE